MPNCWRRRSFLGGIAVLLAGVALLANPALAHAVLVDSAPPPNGVLQAGHTDIRLRFNSRIDAARSRVTVAAAAGAGTVLKLGDSGRPDVLLCPAELAPGSYTLHWQVLAVDGHVTRGTLPFTVTPGSGGQ